MKFWSTQAKVSYFLGSVGVRLLIISNKVYNYRVEKKAQFPLEATADAARQRIERGGK